jgi:diguanylate cyclase (GGDEF)-like protein
MTELATENRPAEISATARRVENVILAGGKVLCVVLVAVGTAWLMRLFIQNHPVSMHWSIQVLLAVLVCLSCGLVILRQRRHWSRPARELADLLEKIHRGEAPIEELNAIHGGPTLLVPKLKEIFRDLKSQRSATAHLRDEMQQRIANRTDALERIIGALRQQATRDALTGLYNRRALDEYLPKMVEKIAAGRGSLCLLMIDVDYFKPLNDTLGHSAGDELLRSIGQLIRSTVRDNDFAFRYGGDEFAIVLPGSDERSGQILAGRLQSLVNELTKPLRARVSKPPQLSIGIATLGELVVPTPGNLLLQADRSLYVAKGGRSKR